MTQIEQKSVPPAAIDKTPPETRKQGGLWHHICKFVEHTAPTAHPRHVGLRAVRYLRRLTDAYMTHQCGLMSCACAYCGVLSLVPLIIVGVAILGVVYHGRAEALDKTVHAVQNYVPYVKVDFLREQLKDVLDNSRVMGIFGMTFLIWGAHQTFLALQPSMNLIWVVPETRHWFKQRMVALAATFFTLVLLSLDLAATFLTAQVASYSGRWIDSSLLTTLLKIITGMLPVLITAILFTTLYKILPDRRVPWKSAFIGACVAAFLWQITKVGFAYYLVNHSEGYTRLYGSLSTIVILVVWMYYTMAILLLGAEIAADYEFMRHGRQAAEDRSHSGADLTSATYDSNTVTRHTIETKIEQDLESQDTFKSETQSEINADKPEA